jgi:hypothetical protein
MIAVRYNYQSLTPEAVAAHWAPELLLGQRELVPEMLPLQRAAYRMSFSMANPQATHVAITWVTG